MRGLLKTKLVISTFVFFGLLIGIIALPASGLASDRLIEPPDEILPTCPTDDTVRWRTDNPVISSADVEVKKYGLAVCSANNVTTGEYVCTMTAPGIYLVTIHYVEGATSKSETRSCQGH